MSFVLLFPPYLPGLSGPNAAEVSDLLVFGFCSFGL